MPERKDLEPGKRYRFVSDNPSSPANKEVGVDEAGNVTTTFGPLNRVGVGEYEHDQSATIVLRTYDDGRFIAAITTATGEKVEYWGTYEEVAQQ